jgi:hypothetical protein
MQYGHQINVRGVTMRLLSSFLALALSTSTALAGDVGPLSPGAPAGVKHAQMTESTALYVLLGAAVIAGIAVAASSGSDAAPAPSPSTTTTTTTGTA